MDLNYHKKQHQCLWLGADRYCHLQVAVMYAYIDGEDFSGSGFDDALRSLLATFRLPGVLYWKRWHYLHPSNECSIRHRPACVDREC